MFYYVRTMDKEGIPNRFMGLSRLEARDLFKELVASGLYSSVDLYWSMHEPTPEDSGNLIDVWYAPKEPEAKSENKTSVFSSRDKMPSHQIQTWKYAVLRFLMNRGRVVHEVIPIEGNILYVLIPCNTNSLRPVIESLQKDCNVYVQMDSFEDSTLLAVMKEWKHAPAELALKHQALRSNVY